MPAPNAARVPAMMAISGIANGVLIMTDSSHRKVFLATRRLGRSRELRAQNLLLGEAALERAIRQFESKRHIDEGGPWGHSSHIARTRDGKRRRWLDARAR